MTRGIARWFFVIVTLFAMTPFAVSAASAQTDSPSAAPTDNPPAPAAPPITPPVNRGATAASFRASCGADAERLCAGVPREHGGLRKCLMTQRAQVSPACMAYLQEKRAERAAKRGTPPAAGDTAPPPAGGSPNE